MPGWRLSLLAALHCASFLPCRPSPPTPTHPSSSSGSGSGSARSSSAGGFVESLERLAALHGAGGLTDAEFSEAKQAAIRLAEPTKALQDLPAGGLSDAEFSEAKRAAIRLAGEPATALQDLPPTPPRGTGAGFSIVAFGADPAGHNDSTAAVNASVVAASHTYMERDCGKGCGRSIADVFVPAGEYILSETIETHQAPGIHGEGTPMLHQINASADIFYNKGVWRTQISGLWFVGGRNHLHLGTNNLDTSFIVIERCVFVNASSAAIRMMPPANPGPSRPSQYKGDQYKGSASTQVTVRDSEFFRNEQVVVNWCDGFSFTDSWVEGCYMPTCSKGKALFENHDNLQLERMLGVPHPIDGYDQRWVDNYHGMVIARNCRFGGEGGGFTVVLNKASFLTVGHDGSMAPQSGPLPNGTGWEGNPQNAAIILDSCQIDSDGNKERQANIWLEQLPAILVVERCQGFAYAPWFGPGKNFSFLKVDPALDLDGPQLDYASQHPHMLRYDIGYANNWGPAGHFWQLPQQLWPYMSSPQLNYETSSDSWGTDEPSSEPPTTGWWQSNQVVLAPLNSTNTSGQPRGWRCVEGGKPGKWTELA